MECLFLYLTIIFAFFSGVVSVVSPLDYEITKGYDLTLTAEDVTSGTSATTKLRIIVIVCVDIKVMINWDV